MSRPLEMGSPVLKANLDIRACVSVRSGSMDAIARCKGLIFRYAHLENMKTEVI